MTSCSRRVVAVLLLLVTSAGSAAAQDLPRFDAGASAGGSAFGWQPRLGIRGETPAVPLGRARLTLDGAFARVDGANIPRSELVAGARVSTAGTPAGWWIGSDVVRRVGLPGISEQPRISSGGWRRIGPLTLGVAASRRSARLTNVEHFGRSVVTYFSNLYSVAGRWDTTATITTVQDSARSSEGRVWMETQGSVAWEAHRWSALLVFGGRTATRDVPAGGWASAEIAVGLSRPVSLVLGGGTARGNRFALDAEHRYLTLGFRMHPGTGGAASAPAAVPAPDAVGPLGIHAVSAGQYRLSVYAPRAHSVEITGDFTGWKPVSLTRGEGAEWSVTLALFPGTHRVNARVDGGAWIVPAGLPTMTDDFAGDVGVLVIEGVGQQRK